MSQKKTRDTKHPNAIDSIRWEEARVAAENGAYLQTFCHLIWPHYPIWNRDTDLLSDPIIWKKVAGLTRTPFLKAEKTTLKYYRNRVFLRYVPTSRQSMVLRLGIYHKTHTLYGQQWCPLCLQETGYYKTYWRFVFATCCPIHKTRLHDRCVDCGQPTCLHRGVFHHCDVCGSDRRNAKEIECDSKALTFETHSTKTLNSNQCVGLFANDPLCYFSTIRQLMRVLATGTRSSDFRNSTSYRWGGIDQSPNFPSHAHDIESLPVIDRHNLIGLVARLTECWPHHLVTAAMEAGIWKSWMLKDWQEPCSPLTCVVDKYLKK